MLKILLQSHTGQGLLFSLIPWKDFFMCRIHSWAQCDKLRKSPGFAFPLFIHLTNINGCLPCTRHSARSYSGYNDESAEILPSSLMMLCCKEYCQSQVKRPLRLEPWNLYLTAFLQHYMQMNEVTRRADFIFQFK